MQDTIELAMLTLRVPAELKEWLQAQARQNRCSMTQYVERVLDRERERLARKAQREGVVV